MPVQGSDLRRERHRRNTAIDALAKELNMTFLDLLTEVEEQTIVSDEVGDVYMRALDRLRPSGKVIATHYGRTD